MSLGSSSTDRSRAYTLSIRKQNRTMFRRLMLLLFIMLQFIQSGLTLQSNLQQLGLSEGNKTELGCERSYFQCNNRLCIPEEKVCNSLFDCKDYSDEEYCQCTDFQFRCVSPRMCIPLLWKCDGENDCLDNSDESGCPCPLGQFRCAVDGFCIANELKCDGIINCNDKSDEAKCSSCPEPVEICHSGVCRIECSKNCTEDQFLCKEKNNCINLDNVCAFIAECPSISNEFDCSCIGDDTFECDNGICISNDHLCDAIDDCSDNSDERDCHCTENQVRCDDGRCMNVDLLCESDCRTDARTQQCGCRDDEFQCKISKECVKSAAVCDGHHNCKDSSDEENCTIECSPNYKCSNGVGCFRELQICDGIYDCADGSDESNCDYTFTCPDGRNLSNYFICDDKEQCEDGSDERNCKYTCRNGATIISRQVCDGLHDCPIYEDERNCTCHGNDGRCPDGRCISNDGICDGLKFCESNFDEFNCPCADSPRNFTCANGLCIPNSYVCDGYTQCGDFSDENTVDCNCPVGQFRCPGEMCIPNFRRCDGTPQCSDGSDEQHCGCFRNQFQCDDDTCIKKNWVCDGVKNCPDGSDESDCGCTKDEFTCTDGSCIDIRYECNGRVDCNGDSSDELNCTCGIGEYRCLNGQCIDVRLKCDGLSDCSDNSDESECQCSDKLDFDCGDGECIPLTHKCNRRDDCPNGVDESDCKCGINEFHCHNGRCVAEAYICDTVDDCGDRSDEINCKCMVGEFRCSNRICVAWNNSKECSDDTEETIEKSFSAPTKTPVDDGLKLSVVIPLCSIVFVVVGFLLLLLGRFTHIKIKLKLKAKAAAESHPGIEFRIIPQISSPVRDLSYADHELNRRCLVLGEMLGHGKFGVVHLGTLRLSKNNVIQVAVKSIGLTASQAQKEDFLDEIKLLINIGKHQNIISVMGCCITDEPYLLVTELMKYGDLLCFLRTCKLVRQGHFMDDPIYCLKENDTLNITRQVARGMDYLSRTRYYHGDLAARNILVGENLNVKISDFGLADDIYLRGFKRLAPERKRPIAWVSLETITEGLCTIKSDVWSFGILLYEVVTLGSPPYPDVSLNELVNKLKSGYRMSQPPGCSDEIYEVMMKCWHTFPSRRPTFSDLYTTFDLMLQRQSMETYYVDCDATESTQAVSDIMVKQRRQSETNV